jgi:hypothetical protein
MTTDAWVMLRGYVPEDRDPTEIIHDSLDDEDCMWVHLWSETCKRANVRGRIVYLDRKRQLPRSIVKTYNDHLSVWFIRETESIPAGRVYFHRGGFPEFDEIVCRARQPALYYGAGTRITPTCPELYRLALVDSEEQKRAQEIPADLFIKPAAPFFRPLPTWKIPKQFDICFIANGPQARIKGVTWFCETVPRDWSGLHLGFPCKHPMPPNIRSLRVSRRVMPAMITRCRVGVLPYWKGKDSGPRAAFEMLACGLPVVIAEQIPIADVPGIYRTGAGKFWDTVKRLLIMKTCARHPIDVSIAARKLEQLIRLHVL